MWSVATTKIKFTAEGAEITEKIKIMIFLSVLRKLSGNKYFNKLDVKLC